MFCLEKFLNIFLINCTVLLKIILSAFKALTKNPSWKNLKSLLSFGRGKKNEKQETGVWMSEVSDE